MSCTLAENTLTTKLPTIEPTRQLGFTDTDDDADNKDDDISLLLLIRQHIDKRYKCDSEDGCSRNIRVKRNVLIGCC